MTLILLPRFSGGIGIGVGYDDLAQLSLSMRSTAPSDNTAWVAQAYISVTPSRSRR